MEELSGGEAMAVGLNLCTDNSQRSTGKQSQSIRAGSWQKARVLRHRRGRQCQAEEVTARSASEEDVEDAEEEEKGRERRVNA